jgi:hypothetical protein
MAQLPNPDRCFVADAKIVDYLLSDLHPEGAPKSKFLKSFGFSAAQPDELRRSLVDHARSHDVLATRDTEFGTIFEVHGRLASPNGRDPWLVVVWIIDTGTDFPRLVTAIPSQEKSP